MPNLKPPVTTTDEALEYREVSALVFSHALLAKSMDETQRCRLLRLPRNHVELDHEHHHRKPTCTFVRYIAHVVREAVLLAIFTL